MIRGRAAAFVVLLAALTEPSPFAQSSSRPGERQSFTSAATAILVDVVVRDKKGRPVTDLSAADFQVAEDGVPQKVDSFTRVSHGSGIGIDVAWRTPATTVNIAAAGTSLAETAGAPEDATTALVFDHLSAESLRLAQKATLEFVPMTGESAARVGVFATDPGVRIIQPYTTNRTRIRQGVEKVMSAGTSTEEQKAQRMDDLLDRRRELSAQTQSAEASATTATGANAARVGSEIGAREMELQLLQTELNMVRSFDYLDRGHKGYDTSTALLSIIESLAYTPGRKTIVFFSEGLPVTPALAAKLDAVIDAANRANVTTYAIDAKGLRSKSSLANMRKEMESFSEERLGQVTTGGERSQQPLNMSFERVEDTLKLDSRTGLARLAEDTGGFLVDETNDLSSAFRRIDEDNQFHYLLTYSPTNAELDGKFRSIQVKVKRSGMQVFARKGYRAIHPAPPSTADSYEAPALALLDRTPLPNAFPVHAAAFSFPDPARPGMTPVLAEVRTNAFRFVVDAERSTYEARAVIVVRLVDGEGHPVQKLSQQYVLTGEAKDVDAARNGEILFYRDPDLVPGVYTMETIVFDGIARQGSARVTTLNVPAAEPSALGMSSLVLVSRVDQVSDAPSPGARGAAPLYVGNRLFYPNLGEPIRRSAVSELPFFFTLYGTETVRPDAAFVQLLRNGQAVAEAPLQLAVATGPRIQHVGRLPIGSLPAGTYELRIRVLAAGKELSRTAFFTLQD
jgi:VWFA-related protein